MKLPIVVDNHGDILLFDTVEDAQVYLEPDDVKNHEYIAYDSEGKKVRLAVKSQGPVTNRFTRLFFPVEEVVLSLETQDIACSEELKSKLLAFIAQVRKNGPHDSNARRSRFIEKIEKIVKALK
jgi:hypothetical protein